MDAQYYLIGTDGRYYGPLTSDDVRVWLLDGRASRYSRARRDTEERWQSLRDMEEFEAVTQPPSTGGAAVPSAGPQPAPGAVDRHAQLMPVLLDPVDCFRRAWRWLMRDFAALAGWALGAELLITATLFIPQIGPVLIPVVDALLTAAVYVVYLARMRGLRPSGRDVALSLGSVALPIVVGNMLQFAVLGVAATLVRMSVDTSSGNAVVSQPVLAAVGAILGAVGVYLAVGYAFVVPLVADKRVTIWRALEMSRKAVNPNWFRFFGLQIARSLLLLASALTLGLALVLTLPLAFAVLMVAYTDLFSD